jgi:sulfofructose kinase
LTVSAPTKITFVLPPSHVDLVGVGLNATDSLFHVKHFPESGSKSEYLSEAVHPGGQVASTVVACQHWGLSTRYVGKLGDDEAAELHQREFARAGVDARVVRAHGVSSARSLVFVDDQGERTVLNRCDENIVLQPGELERDWIVNARLLHIDGHDTDAALLAARWAREAGIPVVADLDDLYPGIEDLLALIDYAIVSRDFPSRLTGCAEPADALASMHRRFGARLSALTLGEGGVIAFDGSHFHHRSAFIVPVVDTTGAGDIFHAGFIYALLQGWPLVQQLDFACAAAAINCTAVGARGRIDSLQAIQDLLKTGKRHPAQFGPASLSS